MTLLEYFSRCKRIRVELRSIARTVRYTAMRDTNERYYKCCRVVMFAIRPVIIEGLHSHAEEFPKIFLF